MNHFYFWIMTDVVRFSTDLIQIETQNKMTLKRVYINVKYSIKSKEILQFFWGGPNFWGGAHKFGCAPPEKFCPYAYGKDH